MGAAIFNKIWRHGSGGFWIFRLAEYEALVNALAKLEAAINGPAWFAGCEKPTVLSTDSI
jgi:hypothetical protein